MNVRAIKTDTFLLWEDLAKFVYTWAPNVADGSVVLIASKVVALSQGRVRDKNTVSKDALMNQEAQKVLPVAPGLALAFKDGHWCPNAGIDESNAFDQYVLWPERPQEVAWELWSLLRQHYAIERLGVIITDSRVFPARHGVTAVALGYAGFRGLKDYRGKKDLASRVMEYTVVNVADALATTGAFLMGEGAESQPLAIIEGAPVEFVSEKLNESLFIDPAEDLFCKLWS